MQGGRDRGSGHGNAGAHGAFGVSVVRRVAVVVAEIESGVADNANSAFWSEDLEMILTI